MEQRILYQMQGLPVAVVTPCECDLTIDEIAKKDVPTGQPYWIVSKAEVDALYAQHGDFRDAWEISQETMGREPNGVGE